ncbi:MAG: hypothetical protein CVV27_14145 [Candidatus Melainabacteria bacterium HGW-Melainabacteria-1]|nr:MAG: hypothetical protein CVV27_14145 [Candidatus Melainabacteria bacterium HGW-Melainabacteria-1]
MLIEPQRLFTRSYTPNPVMAGGSGPGPVPSAPGDSFQSPPPQGSLPTAALNLIRQSAVSQLLGQSASVAQPSQALAAGSLATPSRLFGLNPDLGRNPDEIVDTGRKDVRGRAIKLSRDAAAGLEKMHQIAAGRGIKLKVTSSHRTVAHQQELWENALVKYGSESAARHWVAPPGKSRHNFGKAIDMHMVRGDKRIPQAEFDEIIAMAGMYRPMDHETWHVEPLSTKAGRGRK